MVRRVRKNRVFPAVLRAVEDELGGKAFWLENAD